ncbi:MAG: two-component system response regulator [Rariglobus sp.]|nr:response regulator [Rariglobus sp.]
MPKRPNILVIDDSKAVRLIAQKALAAFDCDVNDATNGFTGLFAMERVLPDLILLDVAMPTMNGDTMLEMMRSNEQLKDLPVIMMISTTDHKVLPRLTALGVSGMVKKPFTGETLVEAVRSVLKLKPAKKTGA